MKFITILVALLGLFFTKSAFGRPPRILVRSGWQTANIGDIAHTSGILSLLEVHADGAEVILWPADIGGDVEPMLRRYFPQVKIVHGRISDDGTPDSPELQQAFEHADMFVCSSAPELHVATKVFSAWRKLTANGKGGCKPYGFYGITIDRKSEYARLTGKLPLSAEERTLLDGAAFIFCRETDSLKYLKEEKIYSPLQEFAPDAVFGVRQYDTERAFAWQRANDLAPGRYICVIPRTRFAPYYLIHGRQPTEEDRKRERYNAQFMDADLGKLRDVITRWVRKTKLKVVVCPEMTFEVGLSKAEIIDKLPADIHPFVVWKSSYWLPDEAAAVYRDAIALLSMECHSPIIAAVANTPSLYLRTPTETSKGQMWNDIGLGDWLINLDQTNASAIADTLFAIQNDPIAARTKLVRAMELVRQRQRETMSVILKNAMVDR